MYDFGFSNGPIVFDEKLPKLQINDANYHEVYCSLFTCHSQPSRHAEASVWRVGAPSLWQVTVIYHQSKKVILLVDKSHIKSMINPKTTLPFSDIYIGGAASSILKSRWIRDVWAQAFSES